MLNYRQTPPPPALRGVVARFSQRRCADAPRHIPAFGLPARLDRFIEFYLGEPVRVGQAGEPAGAAPEIVLVAPHARPGKRLQMVGDVDTFTIHFEPTGLHRLFGLPLQGLADQALVASDALGREVLALRDQLARADHFEARPPGWVLAWLMPGRRMPWTPPSRAGAPRTRGAPSRPGPGCWAAATVICTVASSSEPDWPRPCTAGCCASRGCSTPTPARRWRR